jgi:D-inositol-3-phosphate glycosyltransferase
MNVYVRELSKSLSALGIETDVYTRRQDPNVPSIVEFAPRARVVHVDGGPAKRVDKYSVLDYVSELACNVQRFRNYLGARYDVIHSHYWLSGRLASLFKDHWSVPVAAMFHTLGDVKNRVAQDHAESEQEIRVEIERRTMQLADRVIAATETERGYMAATYGLSPRMISVIPGGVDLDRFAPGSRAHARGILGLADAPTILFVGRIQRLKGIDIAIRATAMLIAEGIPARLLVVGGTEADSRSAAPAEQAELARLRALVSELGVGSAVQFVGAVDQETLPTFYRAADVTVMPSTAESFGLVAVESLACATPVVATRVGGLATIVRDDECGYLVPWRDPRLFADRLRNVLADSATRQRLRRGAVATAAGYGWSSVAARTLDVYNSLVRAPALVGVAAD